MVQVSTAVTLASVALAVGIQGTRIIAVSRIADFDHSMTGKQMTIAGVTSRHDAVEHVHAMAHRLKNIDRTPDTHQITRLILGQAWRHVLQNPYAVLLRLTNRQTTQGIAIKTNLKQLLKRLLA